MRGNPGGSGLLLAARFQELSRSLETFRILFDEPMHGHSNSTFLTLELVSMHLHVSLEDVQLFAGLEGEEEAARVYPSLCDWMKTPTSRQAMWHAGQAVRAAKAMASHHLDAFQSIAVYHTSLALWAYGVILNANGISYDDTIMAYSDPVFATSELPVWLDGIDTVATQRFIALNRGMPALQSLQESQPPALIHDPAAILEVIIDVLLCNPMSSEQLKPYRQPVVENLVQLVYGLRDATRKAGV